MRDRTAEHVDIQRATRAKHAEFARQVGASDAFGLVDAVYAQEARVQPTDAPPIVGRAGIRARFATRLGGGPMTLADWSEYIEGASMVGGDHAWR